MDYIEQLKREVHKLQLVSDNSLSEFVQLFKIEEFRKHDYFSVEGTYPRKVSFVCDGIFRIYYTNNNGDEWNKHFVVNNEFISAGINVKNKSIITIQALTDAVCLTTSVDRLIALSENNTEIETLIQKLIHRVWEKEQQKELLLLSNNAKERYLNFNQNFPELKNHIPHFHIASYLGITPTQLSRVRKKIKSHQQM